MKGVIGRKRKIGVVQCLNVIPKKIDDSPISCPLLSLLIFPTALWMLFFQVNARGWSKDAKEKEEESLTWNKWRSTAEILRLLRSILSPKKLDQVNSRDGGHKFGRAGKIALTRKLATWFKEWCRWNLALNRKNFPIINPIVLTQSFDVHAWEMRRGLNFERTGWAQGEN